MSRNLFLAVAVAIVFSAGSFYVGMQYQKKHGATTLMQFQGNQNQGQNQGFPGNPPNQQGNSNNKQGGGGTGTRPISGEITAIDNDSITIQMQDGSTKIVIVSNSTKINKSQEASKTDLIKGTKVTALGNENSDGTVSAQNITIGNSIQN